MGFFSRLISGLKNTKKSFSEKIKYAFTGNEIDENFFEELEFALISSDMGVSAVEEIIEEVKAPKIDVPSLLLEVFTFASFAVWLVLTPVAVPQLVKVTIPIERIVIIV